MAVVNFRVYSNRTQKMYGGSQLVAMVPGSDWRVWVRDGWRWLRVGASTGVLMQSTGLRDRHGVEIYEGDVVETVQPQTVLRTGPGLDVGIHSWDRVSCEVVVWQDDNNPRWAGCLRWGEGQLEVVGNRYEHPDRVPQRGSRRPEVLT